MPTYARSLCLRFLAFTAVLITGGALVVSLAEWLAVSRRLEEAGLDALTLVLLQLPHRLGLMFPLATLVAAFAVGALAALRNEVVAAQSFGVPPWRLVRETGAALLLLCAVALANQLWTAPEGLWAATRARWRLDPRWQMQVHRLGQHERWHFDALEPGDAAGRGCQVVLLAAPLAREPAAGPVTEPPPAARVEAWLTAEAASWTPGRGWRFEQGRLWRPGAPVREASFDAWSAAELTGARGDVALLTTTALPGTAPAAWLRRGRVRDELRLSDLLGRVELDDRRASGAALHARAVLALGPLLVAPLVLALALSLRRARALRAAAWVLSLCWVVYFVAVVAQLVVARGLSPWLLCWAPLAVLALAGCWRLRRARPER